MQFLFECFFLYELGFIFCYQRRRQLSAECIFYDFLIFAFTQDNPNTRVLMSFAYISI